jgi:hypothetical protein
VDDLRRLRERVSASLFDRHRAGFQRMAAASRLLPIGVLAKIAERTMPPMIAARIAAEMAPERAAELLRRGEYVTIGRFVDGLRRLRTA